MTKLSGRRVMVTGASGLVAYPVAVELAKDNEVFAVARFSDPEQSRCLERAGASRFRSTSPTRICPRCPSRSTW